MDEDYYKILEVSRSASTDELKNAHRKLARKYHPDLNPDDKSAKENFQRVQKAYDVLSDPKKRELYDRYGSSFDSTGGGPRPGSYRSSAGGPSDAGFDDIDFSQFMHEGAGQGAAGGAGSGAGGFSNFSWLFGRGAEGAGGFPPGQQQRRKLAQGASLESSIEIPFATAISGGQVDIGVTRGHKQETIAIKIPPGIESGAKIRLRGQGEPAPRKNGKPGDIIITVAVTDHPCFSRKGKQLFVTVPVSVAEAAFGAKIDVPTPDGTVTMSVPPGASSGTRLRLKGRGVKSAKDAAGDLFAEIQIVLPKKISDESGRLLREFDANNPMQPRDELRW